MQQISPYTGVFQLYGGYGRCYGVHFLIYFNSKDAEVLLTHKYTHTHKRREQICFKARSR